MDNALHTTDIVTGSPQIKGKTNIFIFNEAVLYVRNSSYNAIRLDTDLSSDKNGGW